jgi:hypothetical protein
LIVAAKLWWVYAISGFPNKSPIGSGAAEMETHLCGYQTLFQNIFEEEREKVGRGGGIRRLLSQ